MFQKKYLLPILLLIVSLTPLFSSEVYLKDSLKEAQSGDFVVILQNKNLSLLHILQTDKRGLILEEVSAPSKLKSKIKGKWQDWLEQGAPGHTSWIMYELSLDHCQIEEVYSCTQKSWKKVFPQEQIFSTLVELKFTPIEEKKRKRVGPPVPGGMLDDRSLWAPPIFFEGKKVKGIASNAYSTYWPNDGTDLSGKKIEIFLINSEEKLPNYFPIWLQVSDKIGHAKLRVIDSGVNLTSPNKKLPVPPPELTACHFTREGDLQFLIRSHPAFEEFKVYAKELGSPTCFTLPYTVQSSQNSRHLKILIENEDLNNKLKLDKLYTFIFEPDHYMHLSVETPKPLKLIKQYATK